MIEVVCALIEHPQRGVLACKRPAGSHLGGCWEFPGGKIEADETPEEALTREIFEELGLSIEVGPPLSPVDWSDDRVSIRLRPYRCRIVSGTVVAHEHEEIQWCDAAGTRGIPWAPADRPIVAEWLALRQ